MAVFGRNLSCFLILMLLASSSIFGQAASKPQTKTVKRPFYYGPKPKVEANWAWYGPRKPAISERDLIRAVPPERARLLLRRARSFLFLDVSGGLQRDIERALRIDPDDESIVVEASNLLLETGRTENIERASEVINDYTVRNVPSAAVLDARARVRAETGDLEGAFIDAFAAFQLEPRNPRHSYNGLFSILQKFGPGPQTIAKYQTLIDDLRIRRAEDPLTGWWPGKYYSNLLASAHLHRSGLYRRTGDKEAEFSDLTRAVDVMPEIFLMWRARSYRNYEMYAKAVLDLTRAIELWNYQFPRDRYLFELYSHRADIYEITKRYNQAIEDYQKCLELSPRSKPWIDSKIALLQQRK